MKKLTLLTLFFCASFVGPAIASETLKIVVLGDSLTEGYGLNKEQAFPFLVEKKFREAGKNIEIINAGVSGSTSAGGLSRVAWSLKSKPQYVLIALGANDGLRGLGVTAMKKNLVEIIQKVKAGGAKPLLIGMKMPPNYGVQYTKEFEGAFQKVADEQKVPLLPFLLDRVATNSKLNLPDGIHPNQEGHKTIAETVFKFLEKNI